MLLCSYGSWTIVTHQDPFSLFSCLGGCQWGYGLEQWWKLKKGPCSGQLLSSALALTCRTPALLPSLCYSQMGLFPATAVSLAECSPAGPGREGELFCWAMGEPAVYYWLPLDTDTRVPILTAAVRLPGVRNQQLLKQSVVLYFSRNGS